MLRRKPVTCLAAALLAVALAPDAKAGKRAKHGLFGTVNGKAFKGTNVSGPTDPCAIGIYQPGALGAPGSVVFTVIECKPKRRRQGVAVKKNYKMLIMACSKFDWNTDTTTFPWELDCGAGSAYSETKTGRYGVPLSQTIWGGSDDFLSDPPTHSLKMRIDGVEGNVVRGVVTGTFDTPLQGAPASPAPISGELTFEFPFQIQ